MRINLLFDIIYHQLENFPRDDAFSMKIKGVWQDTPSLSFVNQVNKISRGLLKYGIAPQDKIAIISSNNRTEWHIMDFGTQQIGAISVPIYPTLNEEDIIYIFNDSEVKFCFVSDKDLYNKIYPLKNRCPNLVGIFSFDEVNDAPNWQEVISMGEDDDTQDEVESLKNMVKPEDIMTLIYTSGTTGKPKGVPLTHKNIVSNILACQSIIPQTDAELPKALSFLPLCHVFERMVMYLFILNGMGIYYAECIEKIGENIKEIKPHFMMVVPRLVEKVYNSIYMKGTEKKGLKSLIFLWALKIAEKHEPFSSKSLKFLIADRLVFSKWREGLGGNIVCLVCGSAALSERLNRIFFAAGIPILEGYGLTETSPVIAVNGLNKDDFRLGTVGKVIKNVTVKIASDGEILVKGDSVFSGYYHDAEKTKNAFDDSEYFKTEDIGNIEDGFLKITDRKKEMFKTSGGKYIAPQSIENEFKESLFVEQIMVVGEGEKMPCAIIQPDFTFIKDWASHKGFDFPVDDLSMICNNPIIIDRIQEEVDKVNHKLGKWEKIKKFVLTPEIWSVENGLLSPTLKLKRKTIKSHFLTMYNKLYRE